MTDDGFEKLFQGDIDDLAAAALPLPAHNKKANTDPARHIGCPLWWFNAVFPIIRSKNELVVALILYRQHMIEGDRTIAATNGRLMAEMGISRFTKYRTIRKLEKAGLVTVQRRGKRAPKVTFPRRRRSRKGA